jgi:HEAT repeat protein
MNIQIKDNTVETLIMGLNSDNIGLKSGSAYMIGELQISEAVIPLLKILHTEKNEDLRIAAALALYKIGSPVAIYAVKQTIKFDDSERVSKLCTNFYNEYLRNKLNDEEINVDVSKTALK